MSHPNSDSGRQPALSLVIPAYNEAENLPVLAEEIRQALEPTRWSYEVLFVDDGSSDDTPRVLERLTKNDPAVRALRLLRNSGQSAALVAGIRRARGRIVVTLDADLQNDPADIPSLLEALEDHDVDLVSGVRSERQDTWLRRLSSRIANRVRDGVLHDGITDVGCSLKAYRREALEDLPQFTGMHRFLPALVQLHGGSVIEIPVRHRPRLHGQPKYNVRNRLWKGINDLLAVRWMQKRWIRRQDVQETSEWSTRPSGFSSASSDEASSSPAPSSSGAPPSDASEA